MHGESVSTPPDWFEKNIMVSVTNDKTYVLTQANQDLKYFSASIQREKLTWKKNSIDMMNFITSF